MLPKVYLGKNQGMNLCENVSKYLYSNHYRSSL